MATVRVKQTICYCSALRDYYKQCGDICVSFRVKNERNVLSLSLLHSPNVIDQQEIRIIFFVFSSAAVNIVLLLLYVKMHRVFSNPFFCCVFSTVQCEYVLYVALYACNQSRIKTFHYSNTSHIQHVHIIHVCVCVCVSQLNLFGSRF